MADRGQALGHGRRQLLWFEVTRHPIPFHIVTHTRYVPNASVLIWVPDWPAEFILNLEETGYRSPPKCPLWGAQPVTTTPPLADKPTRGRNVCFRGKADIGYCTANVCSQSGQQYG